MAEKMEEKNKTVKYVPNSPQVCAWLDEYTALSTMADIKEKGPGILACILHENPNCYSAHCYLGEVMFLKGNVKVAMEHFEKAKASIEKNVPGIEVDIHKARLKKRFIFFFTNVMKLNGLCYEAHLKKLVKLTKSEWVSIADEVIGAGMTDMKYTSGEELARWRNELLRCIRDVGERDASNAERYKRLIAIEKVLPSKVVDTKVVEKWDSANACYRHESEKVYYYDKYDKDLFPAKQRIEEYKLALQILSPQAYEELLQQERELAAAQRTKKRIKGFFIFALVAAAAVVLYMLLSGQWYVHWQW